jgi:hypothetical protein
MNCNLKILLSILLLGIVQVSLGKSYSGDSIVNRITEDLSLRGIDTVLVYEKGDVGSDDVLAIRFEDTCYVAMGTPREFFIFWQRKGKSYVTRFDESGCNCYDTLRYNMQSIWNSCFANMAKIKKEKILSPEYMVNGEKSNINVDHYAYRQIYIITPQDNADFEINQFYFQKLIDDKYANLNYAHNTRTFRKQLADRITNEVEQIKKKHLLHRHLVRRKSTEQTKSTASDSVNYDHSKKIESFHPSKKYTVISDKTQLSWFKDSLVSFWTPTAEDYQLAESILMKAIRGYASDRGNRLSQETASKYYRQYVFYRNTRGDSMVFINAFCEIHQVHVDSAGTTIWRPEDWQHQFIRVNDGGDCYWSILINLTRKSYERFNVNGMG